MHEMTPKKLLANSFHLTHFLAIKYGNTKEDYETMCIDALIYSLSSHYLSIYKEVVLWNDKDEFLKREYTKKEAVYKIPKLASYYKNYQLFFGHPIFCNFAYDNIIQNYGDNKAELFYKNAYGNKHGKRAHNNTNNIKDHNISLVDSSETNGKDYVVDNKTIFDMVSRKAIENNVITSIDFITNQSNSQSHMLLSNYNNENLFYTKRNSVEDSLVFLVDYMNKKKNKSSKRKRGRITNIFDTKRRSKEERIRSRGKENKTYKPSSVEKTAKSFIISMYNNKKRSKASSSLSNHTPNDLNRMVSPKLSQNSSNNNTYNTKALSPPSGSLLKTEFPQKAMKFKSQASKYSFNSSNIPGTENNQLKVIPKQSVLSKYLSSNKGNSYPQQKKPSGLYKKPASELIQPTSKQNSYFNYLNNCTSRFTNSTKTMTEVIFSDRHQTKDKSLSVNSNKNKKYTSLSATKTKGNQKSTTRNIHNPINKISPSILTVDNRTASAKIDLTVNPKINVNLTMTNTPSFNNNCFNTKTVTENRTRSNSKSTKKYNCKSKVAQLSKYGTHSKLCSYDKVNAKDSNLSKNILPESKDSAKNIQNTNQVGKCNGLSAKSNLTINWNKKELFEPHKNNDSSKPSRNKLIIVNRTSNLKAFINQNPSVKSNGHSSNLKSSYINKTTSQIEKEYEN